MKIKKKEKNPNPHTRKPSEEQRMILPEKCLIPARKVFGFSIPSAVMCHSPSCAKALSQDSNLSLFS